MRSWTLTELCDPAPQGLSRHVVGRVEVSSGALAAGDPATGVATIVRPVPKGLHPAVLVRHDVFVCHPGRVDGERMTGRAPGHRPRIP